MPIGGKKMNNRKLTRIYCIMIFVFSMFFFQGCSSNSSKTNNKNNLNLNKNTPVNNLKPQDVDENVINKTVGEFIGVLENNDREGFKKLISNSGLIVIRSFLSGDEVKGKNIRNVYKASEMPSNLEFPVKDEIPISPREILNDALKIDVKNISYYNLEQVTFNFKDNKNLTSIVPSTDEIWELCGRIRSAGSKQYEPQIYILGNNEFALTLSSFGLNTGVWAVFERCDEDYYLRAIMDFR